MGGSLVLIPTTNARQLSVLPSASVFQRCLQPFLNNYIRGGLSDRVITYSLNIVVTLLCMCSHG